jgi:hypothetical protein
LLRINGLSENNDDQTKKNEYLPLIVAKTIGCCFNKKYQPNQMLLDNDKVYASNYPRPKIVFAHMHG